MPLVMVSSPPAGRIMFCSAVSNSGMLCARGMMPNERRLAMRQPVTSMGPSAVLVRTVWCRMATYSDFASVPLRCTRRMMIFPSEGDAPGGTAGVGEGVLALRDGRGELRRKSRPNVLFATGCGFRISELPGPVAIGPEPERSRESGPLWLNAMMPAMRTTTIAMMPSAFIGASVERCADNLWMSVQECFRVHCGAPFGFEAPDEDRSFAASDPEQAIFGQNTSGRRSILAFRENVRRF